MRKLLTTFMAVCMALMAPLTVNAATNAGDDEGLMPDVDVYQYLNGRYQMIFSGESLDFGSSQEPVAREIVLSNSGDTTFVLRKLVVPEGFTADIREGDTLPPDSAVVVTITMTAGFTGQHDGDMIIDGESLEDFKLHLTGNIIGTDYWYEDFENGMPAAMQAGAIWTVEQYAGSMAAVARTYSGSAYEGEARYLISPRLSVKQGEVLRFQAAKSTYYLPSLSVYHSTDRQTWTLLHAYTSNDFDRTTINTSGACRYTDMVIDNAPEGEGYIMWEGFACSLDNINGFTLVPPTDDVLMTSVTLPTQGEVNSELTATVTLKNYGIDYAAGECGVELLFDNEVVATALNEGFNAGQEATAVLVYVPHEAGEHTVAVRFVAGEYVIDSEVQDLLIADEVVAADAVIGDPGSISVNSEVPIDASELYTVGEYIYPADQVNLTAGTLIKSITLKGRNTGQQCITDVQVWIENTTDAEVDNYALHPTDNMQLIYDDPVVFPKAGSAGMTPVHADMMVITLAEPFVYDGTNLRLRFHSIRGTSGTVKFQCDPDAGVGMFQSNYKDEFTYCRSVDEVPVLYLTIEKPVTVVAGYVTDAVTGEPVVDATVTAAAGQVYYTAVTDETGEYSITVLKDNLDGYVISATADGYESVQQELDLSERDITVDFSLTPIAPLYDRGDVNADGNIDGSDINLLIDVVLGKQDAELYDGRADVNGDGNVDGSDINMLIDIVLGKY